MKFIDYGDVERILRNQRISSTLLGAGLGSVGGMALGENTGWYDDNIGFGVGAVLGGLGGYKVPRIPYDKAKVEQLGLGMAKHKLVNADFTDSLIPYNGYWLAPRIGAALLGAATGQSATDSLFGGAVGGLAGFVAGNQWDKYQVNNTRFPKVLGSIIRET